MLNWLSSSSSSSLGCWVTAHRPTLNLRPSRATRGKTLDSRSAGRQHPLRLLEHDGHHRQPLVELGVVEVGGRPLARAPGGRGRRRPAPPRWSRGRSTSTSTTLPSSRSRSDGRRRPTRRASAAMHGSSTMRRARRCTTCRVLSATRPFELDVAEAGQVVERGEGQQPRQALVALARVVALQLEQRLLLRPAPVVGGAQVVDGELGQADPQRARCWAGGGRRRCAAARRPTGGGPAAVRYSPWGSTSSRP